jgi:ribosomal protein S18 acetylase RimI-like enzyme
LSTIAAPALRLRPARPDDAGSVARILYAAFAGIHDRHRFPRDFPTLEAAAGLAGAFIAHPSIWGVVAERDGRIVGSNFADERGSVRGVGPITVDPDVQESGVGRRLMEAVMDRSAGAEGIRLLQDAFNTRSMALYAALGFEITDPVALVSGRLDSAPAAGYDVRPLTDDDLAPAAALSLRIHGYERTAELADALASRPGESFAAIRDGRLVGYATTLTVFPAAHAVAESAEAMSALIAGALATTDAPASFLLPTRQHELFRWALAAGLRVVKPMNYMVTGHHREPAGAWIPSVLY